MMINSFDKNWTTTNGNVPLNDNEVERYISVRPSENQLRLADKPFYCFIHFGMNTATGREWGAGIETVKDFTIKNIDAAQWVKAIKSSGATGIILTCKHHDGFCLWNSEYTDFCVKNTDFKGDIVKLVSDECHKQGMDFGIYLSPWDMHDKRYGTTEYDDYFCNQLTELLTNYGEIFEVWFDGAKGSNAVKFEYDWQRYYD
ncbi:MAG: alpha-L-fucosidase, partial [Eubacterium sp.]